MIECLSEGQKGQSMDEIRCSLKTFFFRGLGWIYRNQRSVLVKLYKNMCNQNLNLLLKLWNKMIYISIYLLFDVNLYRLTILSNKIDVEKYQR